MTDINGKELQFEIKNKNLPTFHALLKVNRD